MKILSGLWIFTIAVCVQTVAQRQDIKNMPMKKTVITAQQAEKLLSGNKHIALVPKVLKFLKAEKGFILKKDQQTIIYYPNKEIVVAPFVDVNNLLLEMDKVFYGDPKPKDIIDNIDENMLKFKSFFKLTDKEMTDTVAVFKRIDAMYPRLENEGVSESEIFYPLVTYFGEFFVTSSNGSWQTAKNNEGKSFPAVVGSDGKLYDPYFSIRKILVNGHKPFSFQAAIRGQLEENKLKIATPAKDIPLDNISIDVNIPSKKMNRKGGS